MLKLSSRSASLALLVALISGCFSSADVDTTACDVNAESVAMRLEARYALGAKVTLSLSGLSTPAVASSDPDIVRVGAIHEDGHTTLQFVGEGEASITVSNASDHATATVEVAELERFEVVLPSYTDPLIPLFGKSLIFPEFEVVYFDSGGRLHGRGLAETSWKRSRSWLADVFSRHALESGPHVVNVRVGALESSILFGAAAVDDVVALDILETDLGEGRVRVDAVGLTESGTEVWNIVPYFQVDDEHYTPSFEYTFDPDAPTTRVVAESFHLTYNGTLDPAETQIRRAQLEEPATTAAVTPTASRPPVMALLSLLLMALAIRVGVTRVAARPL